MTKQYEHELIINSTWDGKKVTEFGLQLFINTHFYPYSCLVDLR